MKISPCFVAVLTASSVALFAGTGSAQTDPAASPAVPAQPAPARVQSKLFYKPPADAGNIPTRVSGGARGGGVDASLLALVPEHAALTTKAQPSLFWFQSKSAKARLELTLVEPKKAKPLLALTSEVATAAGMHRIQLAKHHIELKPDVLYEWNVAIVSEAENRSKDTIARGVIKRIKAPDDLAKSVARANDLDRAELYAEAGIWYDALEAVSDAIDAHPADAALHAQRASLLQQVGLPEAAAADKK